MVSSSGGKTETQPGLCGEGPYRVKSPISRSTQPEATGWNESTLSPKATKQASRRLLCCF